MLTYNLLQGFLVGWINITGWLVVVTVQGYFAGECTTFTIRYLSTGLIVDIALFICAAVVVGTNGAFIITPAKTYGIFLAITTFTTAVNIWGNKILGRWNDAACE